MNVSFQQRQFFLLQNLDPESSAYNIPLVFTIDGALDIRRFEHAVVTLFSSVDIMTSSIKSSNGSLETALGMATFTNLNYSDMSGSTPEQIFEYLDRFITKSFVMGEILYRTVLIKQEQNSYIWCLVLQHSISDLKTKEVLCKLIGELYNNPSTHIPGTVTNYADYVQHQISWLASESATSQKHYWQSALEPVPKMLTLPVDTPRPSFLRLKGNVVYIEFDQDTTLTIKNCAAQYKVTPFLWLLTSYAIVLGKYANQDYFSIGVPFTNRRDDAFKETIGCFVNTLPVTIDFREPGTVLDLMSSIRKSMLLGHRNQEYPTELIVKDALQKGNSLDANPVYQAGFTFEPFVKLALDGCDVNQRYMHHGGSQLDLFATFWEDQDCLSGVIEYNSTIFHERTIERFAENFKHVVVETLDNPQLNVHHADIVCRNERALIDTFCKGRDQSVAQGSDFVSLFRKSVDIFTIKNAVTFKDKVLSYIELDKMSDTIAKCLLERGITNNQFVGIYLDRSEVMLAAITGVLKAGAAYVPLDPQFPKDRIEFICSDALLATILTEQKYCDSDLFKSEQMINVDAFVNTPQDNAVPTPSIHLADAAYMIYTSGSTGKPKGVIITHGNLANFILSMLDDPGISRDDVFAAITTISFDIHILELLVPLCIGATVKILPREMLVDLDALAKELEMPVTIVQGTPSIWKMLCASGWNGGSHLRILCGGEALTIDLASQLTKCCKSLHNMYGPTETTVWSTMYKVKDHDNHIFIGSPIANTNLLVVDKWGIAAPLGCWGELYIGGAGVARGYHNRPELTLERFKNPGTDDHVSKYYSTGDIARVDDEGRFECAGRVDNQVKIRGYRIELEEIECALEQVDCVGQSAVIVTNDQGFDTLCAFIVPRNSDDQLDIGAIRKSLQSRVPEYMIPSRYIKIQSLPLTPNYKVDRNALKSNPALLNQEISPGDTHSGLHPLEQKIFSIWRDRLHLSVNGIHENFFDSGGNSLLILQYRSILQTELMSEISIPVLFQYTTIKTLADHLNQHTGDHKKISSKQDRIARQKSALQSLKRSGRM